MGSTVADNTSPISLIVSDGRSENMRATTPETWGAAIDVPLID
jgi:hypothetical protein